MHKNNDSFDDLVNKELDIKPIKGKKKLAEKQHKTVPAKEPGKPEKTTTADTRQKPTTTTAQPNHTATPGKDTDSTYQATGVSKKQFSTWKNMAIKHNRPKIIDLHGELRDSAARRISEFITELSRSGTDTGCIIHGKGSHSRNNRAVLKNMTRTMLQQHPQVKAYFTVANGGAVMIWLKKT